ncbi:MAG: FAD-dependent monooxygenase [Burkholderiales bacterium]|nr:FAD-dependent monooxygenase [Phycisphaerae bacterium]
MTKAPDVIVVGAGPAGSLAATLLARAGASVTIIEQSRFPRDKVCGECLSALGREVLRRHGLEQFLIDRGAIELTRAALHSVRGTATLDLPAPMLGVSRSLLDGHLLDQARRAGATIVQPARAERLLGVEGSSRPALPIRDLSTNDVRDFAADVILVASGVRSLLGRTPMPSGDLGIKAHFQNVNADRQAIALFATANCYGGIAPIEVDRSGTNRSATNRWNVAFSIPASRIKTAGRDVDAAFRAVVDTNRSLAKAMRGSDRLSDWLASPLPRYAVSDDWPTNVVPIGNSAAAIEPIGGEGMGLALRSAEIAVECVLARTQSTLADRYRSLWRTRRFFCRAGAILMSNPTAADAGVELLATMRNQSRSIMSLVGK